MTGPSGNETSSGPSHLGTQDKRQLSTLVDMDAPEAVHKEVVHILKLINPSYDIEPVDRVFRFTLNLYKGHLQEYKACNTDYHNLHHITDTYLAMARLLHGAQLNAADFTDREIFLGLAGALMHDAGMIQESCDSEGTGAKYTQEHVLLSMDFVAKHGAMFRLSKREIADLRDMILCTDLLADIPAIDFSRSKIELLGKILGTADLIAQMADRTYLEKLLFLYHEFREARLGNYANEVEFLRQTLNFFAVSAKRFRETLDDSSRYMVPHFTSRWDIKENLYILSLENQRKFLEKILAEKNISVYRKLKRKNIADKVRRKFADNGSQE